MPDFDLDTDDFLDEIMGPAEKAAAPKQVRSAQKEDPRQPGPGPQETLLYFDIETVPDYDRLPTFGLDDVPPIPEDTPAAELPSVDALLGGTVDNVKAGLKGIVAPADWLDRVAAAENAGKNRAGVYALLDANRAIKESAAALHADRCKLLSTTPEYCSIAALGWAIDNGVPQSLVVGQEYGGVVMNEADILARFWELASAAKSLVGFNVLGFDLPVIFVRSAILGVPATRMLDLKPWGRDVLDLYLLRFGGKGNTDKQKPGRLKALAGLYGLDVPAGDVDGSQVDELMRTDPAKVAEYVRSDIEITRGLHRALAGYFWK